MKPDSREPEKREELSRQEIPAIEGELSDEELKQVSGGLTYIPRNAALMCCFKCG